jgi:hypothetical protein
MVKERRTLEHAQAMAAQKSPVPGSFMLSCRSSMKAAMWKGLDLGQLADAS